MLFSAARPLIVTACDDIKHCDKSTAEIIHGANLLRTTEVMQVASFSSTNEVHCPRSRVCRFGRAHLSEGRHVDWGCGVGDEDRFVL